MTQSINLNEMFGEFNKTYGYEPMELNSANLKKSVKLISDEVVETLIESDAEVLDKPRSAKELTDILYMTMQQMSAYNLDIHACLQEVHRSNLSKTVSPEDAHVFLLEVQERYPNAFTTAVDGRVVLRCGDTGKVIKPSCYSEADMQKVLDA